MARASVPEMPVDRLAAYLVGAANEELADELSGWLAGSARFRVFSEQHRDKIRKKLRGARDPESLRDVRAELRVAHLLLADKGINLAFEAYGSDRGGPDFTVGYRGERPFNLEVTRLHGPPSGVVYGGPLLAKLRQLPPSVPNAIVIAVEGQDATALDVERGVLELRRRADRKDDAFFAGRGYEGTHDFYGRFLRLGVVYVWAEAAESDGRVIRWVNRSARIEVAARAARACLACLRAS